MKRSKFVYCCIRALLPSIWFNFRHLPIRQAIRLPILLYKPKISCLGGVKIVSKSVHPGMIRLGFPKSVLFPNAGITLQNKGIIVFNGKCEIGNNSYIVCLESGRIEFGNDFTATSGLKIVSACGITFGEHTLIGWENVIMDTNFHPLYNMEKESFDKAYGEIKIGDNNWFSSYCMILHSVETPNDIVFGTHAIVKGKHFEPFCVYGGNPLRIIKTNVKRIVGNDTIDCYM
jgi:acetyltransferase-like isoleucine patch superfamily enzyme